MKKNVDVIITTFGRKDELKRAVESVLKQTYRNINIIIVDDNVNNIISDYVKELIKSYNDNRIIYIKNSENLGGALSRNEGILKSTSDYVAFLDDDDEYLPEKIEKQLNLFVNSNDSKLALVYCYCDAINNGKITHHYKYNYIGNCLYESMITCFAATSQWMCKKDALLSVGMFSDVPCKQDSNLILKLMAAGYSVDRVPEVLSIYHEEDIPRISNNKYKKRIEGETKLLELARNNYSKLTLKEQNEVEYEYACRLLAYYYLVDDKNKYKQAKTIINKVHPFNIKTITTYCGIIKKKIKRIIMKNN